MDLEDPEKQMPELLQREIDKLRKRETVVRGLKDAALCAIELKKEFSGIVTGTRIDVPDYGVPRIWVTADIDSIHDATPVLRLMAKRGFRQTSEPTDMPDSGVRTYWANPLALMLTFSAHRETQKAKAEKEQEAIEKGEVPQQQCAYVKVGEKTIDVLELRCAGDPAYEAHFNKESE